MFPAPLLAGKIPELPQFRSQLKSISFQESGIHYQPGIYEPGPLGISQLAPDLMPTEALQRSLKRGVTRLARQLHTYPDRQGDPALRLALEEHFSAYGFPLSAKDLVITGGCIDGVRIALETVSDPGDAIAISSPCFSGLLELLAGLNRNVVEIPSTAEGIDLDQFEALLKAETVKAGLFSTSHMNPQGISMTAAQKQRLAELANHYQVPVIEDDIYIELGQSKTLPLPAKYWDKGGFLLWCGSVSKTLSAGFRVGWCLPGRFFTGYERRHGVNHFGISTPVQAGLADFINTGQYRRHLNRARIQLQRNLQGYREYLLAHLPEGSAVSQPTGGMVLWLQIPGLNSQQLWQQAVKAGLDLRIGPAFTTLDYYQDYVRINAGWPLDDKIETLLECFIGLVKRQLVIQPDYGASIR
ncbi:PLP-dependent aminotransferase family protein [Oceanospirillum linum]|uniref:aminotransferase-like domain-containing protein n=1 Tax=Oceanospirillum linum TaxID=966 RepID=UPI00089EC41D|nr:PLP-dependent aminotransferase family protein [Oceanospirillum linum]SEG14551.1 DNA-binding transcriptional regulator, MocR family, contains an aminotransferase domain [Oleiphilus messinensis]SMP10907.1 transcriptional regulator, GntR family [Oceanospirillum linum]